MKKLKESSIIAFIILSYLISWIIWLPIFFMDQTTQSLIGILTIVGGLGPFAAAIIISRFTGLWEAFKALLFKWRVNFRWYLLALLLPIFLAIVAFGIFIGVGGTPRISTETPPIYFYPIALLFVMILGGGLEEPGWRGFALPELLKRHNPLVASLIIGVIWVFWHFPLFFIPTSSQYELPFGWYFLNTLSISVIFTWLFFKSKGSTIIAIIFHGGLNAVFSWYPGLNQITTGFGIVHFYAPITAASTVIAMLVIAFDRRIFFQRKSKGYAYLNESVE